MGNYVIIDYGNGIEVRAMHMYRGTISVNVNDTVEAGQVLGKIGHSGDSTGPHLHLDMKINGQWVDISKYIAEPGIAVSGSNNLNLSGASNINMSRNIVPNNRNGYKIDIDLDEEVELMLERLKEEGFKLEGYLGKAFQRKHLKNYLKAAIVTQYPDLRSAEEIKKDKKIKDSTEVQGCIKVKRYADGETEAFAGNSLSNPKDSDNGIFLSYRPYNEFTDLISNGDKSALNYFSLDSYSNMVVAGWETLDVNVTIEQTEGDPDPNPDPVPEPRAKEYAKLVEKKVNHLNQVSNYTIPFSFFFILLVYGNDEKFVNDFAQLVIDTEIVIGCYDATNIKKSTYTNTYTKTYTINRTAGIGDYAPTEGGYEARATSVEVKTCKYKVTEKHTLKTDIPSLKVKYANTWTAIYNNEYKINNKAEDPTESTADLENENLGSTHDYKYDEETKDIVDNDESLQKDIDSKIEELRKSTSEYNQQNFAYRYEKLTKSLNERYKYTEDSDDSYKLLHDEDVQNYLINMIIDENSQEYILDTFKNNETIKRAAKKIDAEKYEKIQEKAGKHAQKIVSELEENNLGNDLTQNGSDTRKNKTYSSEVTSVDTEEKISKVDQKEKIETNTTKSEVQEVTTGTNQNVIMKTDKTSKENSFVRLLYYSKSAKSNLKVLNSWFFESMEETAAIADMIDLVKYLFNFVYNRKTEFTKEQIKEITDLFDPEKMSTINRNVTSAGTIVGGASYSSLKLSEEDMQIIYKLIEAEDGSGEDIHQKHHVCVIYNRLLSSAFSNNVKDFIDGGQFEVCQPGGTYWTCTPSEKTIRNCNEALKEGDSTGGAIGFVNIWLWEARGGKGFTYEPSIELFREIEPGGDAVYFTTENIRKELAQYAN